MTGIRDDELSGELGPPDVGSMETIRDTVLHMEPIVDGAGFDSVLSPRSLLVELADGIGDAESGRFDIVWYYPTHTRFTTQIRRVSIGASTGTRIPTRQKNTFTPRQTRNLTLQSVPASRSKSRGWWR